MKPLNRRKRHAIGIRAYNVLVTLAVSEGGHEVLRHGANVADGVVFALETSGSVVIQAVTPEKYIIKGKTGDNLQRAAHSPAGVCKPVDNAAAVLHEVTGL